MNTGGFGFYLNAALTNPIPKISSIHDGSVDPTSNDFQLFVGSIDPAKTLQSTSGNLTVEVFDTNGGGGIPDTRVKLAATQGGLGAGGQTLDLGATSIAGGVGNAVTVWARVTDPDGTPVVSTELKIRIQNALVV